MLAEVLTHYGADLSRVREVGWVSLKCPFHDDSHASARVNLDLGGFACLACGVKGDAIKLIMEKEGLDYLGAVGFAEEVFGARVEGVSRAAPRKRERSAWRSRLFD